MFEIIPSPGTEDKDLNSAKNKIETIKPLAKTIHIDVLDGIFAPNTTFLSPSVFEDLTQDAFFEAHLMVQNPINYIQAFADSGFKRFIGQVEQMGNQEEFVRYAKKYGEVGLALDKQSELDSIKIPFEELDTILVMTIQAGFSGQTFLPELLEKVKALKEKCNLPIEVDGGINDATISLAKEAGATRFVATSFIFGDGNPEENFRKLQACI